MAMCRHGDPYCPCQDGDTCHYAGPDAWPPPPTVELSCHCGETLAVPVTRDRARVLHLNHEWLAEHLSGHDERRIYTAADVPIAFGFDPDV
jgi:hypothetical protein